MAGGLVDAQLANGGRIRAGLHAAPKEMRRELRKSHKDTAKEGERWIRDGARSGTPQQRRNANAIKGASNATQALIRTVPGGKGSRTAGAQGAFYGAKKYPQFPRWVGNNWKPGVSGQGPQPHNNVLAAKKGDLETIFIKGQDDALRRALPRY